MKHALSCLLAAALAVTPVAVQAGEKENLLGAVSAAFDPYKGYAPATDGDWGKPLYTRATTALIDAWEKGLSQDEVEDLNGFGWFCECQDYDVDKFTFALKAPALAKGATKAVVTAAIDIGYGQPDDKRRLTFAMVKEGGRWLIDDVTSQTFPKGVKVELRKAIAAHKATGRP